ncbi:MAG: hypothetical protein HY547_00930 [Elusimicrobia bacterium]|nr:hypothetical protein [Elusimicrobiota bacterium]
MPSLQTTASARPRPALSAGIRLGEIFSLSEPDYESLILSVESDPLFHNLTHASTEMPPVICRRFPKRPLESIINAPLLMENLINKSGQGSWEFSSIGGLLKKLGEERLRKHFLDHESGQSLEQRALACGLSLNEASLVESFCRRLELYSPVENAAIAMKSKNHRSVSVVAALIKDSHGKLVLQWLSTHYAQGPYVVRQKALLAYKRRFIHSPDQRQRLAQLLSQLQLINARLHSWQSLGRLLLKKQQRFLHTENWLDLRRLTQEEIARGLGIAPSTVSRLLKNRAWRDLNGRPLTLGWLAPSRADIIRLHLEHLLERAPGLTNAQLAKRISRALKSPVTARLIYNYRMGSNV